VTVIASAFGLSFASALVPLINIEAILAVLVTQSSYSALLLSVVAGLGQMAGKWLWYWGGSNVDRAPWVARHLEKPKARASLDRWYVRVHGRPYLTAGILFVSAFAGFPPYAIMAVLAGILRVPLSVFLVTGFVGRTLRFYLVATGADLVMEWW
jgi:membrane protein YqaA with SNARE-associated domain